MLEDFEWKIHEIESEYHRKLKDVAANPTAFGLEEHPHRSGSDHERQIVERVKREMNREKEEEMSRMREQMRKEMEEKLNKERSQKKDNSG